MGEWVLEEADQCWWELYWLWQSEGVKTNLTSGRVKPQTTVTIEEEIVEIVA